MLDIYIEGETIDLAIPTEEFAYSSEWYSWLNRKDITRFLEQGDFPNTPESQLNFYRTASAERLLLVVQTKSGEAKGIVSLSFIDQKKKCCDFALLIDSFVDIRNSGISTLEATSLIIEHGFESLGMHRIQAGQHTRLADWQHRMELIGFRLEGIHRGRFVKGLEVADSVSLAVTEKDYFRIKHYRGGSIFDSSEKMLERIRKLPNESFKLMLENFMNQTGEDYYKKIFEI